MKSGLRTVSPRRRCSNCASCFVSINNGRVGDVAAAGIDRPTHSRILPRSARPRRCPQLDTKGLSEVAVRADLDARLKDTRTHVVLCSTFYQAPSTSVQLILDHLRNAHGVRVDTGKVSVLALPRDDEAMAVKDDSGEPPIDDEDGYHLKRDQILRNLAGGDRALERKPILFFNAEEYTRPSSEASSSSRLSAFANLMRNGFSTRCAAADEVVRRPRAPRLLTSAVRAVADQLSNFLVAHGPLATACPTAIRGSDRSHGGDPVCIYRLGDDAPEWRVL